MIFSVTTYGAQSAMIRQHGGFVTLGPGQTLMDLFDTWKGFVAKLDVNKRDIQTATFRYFKHLKAFSVDHQVNAVEIRRATKT
ncbi:unnamed protein product [Clavelina lepadiformis]|uniref:Uncharacterized protein n=1 Tax=Clavelina lepadiformis TaxID=159417 RepID=A0ABP0GCP6_CLALP